MPEPSLTAGTPANTLGCCAVPAWLARHEASRGGHADSLRARDAPVSHLGDCPRPRAARSAAAKLVGMTDVIQDAGEDAFAELVAPHRRELHAHCYRMLGSIHDADDALQEALLGAWKGLSGFEGRSSLRSWLYTIATHASLRVLEGRGRRGLPGGAGRGDDPRAPLGEPLVESVWIEPYPDELVRYEDREGVELAYVAALQLLAPNQRAVLLLRDVLGFSAAGDRRDARDLGRRRSTAPCSGPARSSSASARPVPSRRRCGRWATSARASSSRASSRPGTAPTSRRSSRC